MTTDEKLQHFLDTCLEDANTQSQEMLSKYEAFAEEEFKAHKEKIEKDAAYMIKAETLRLTRENNKKLSKQQFELMHEFSSRNEELKDMLFVEVKDMLEEYMAGSAYIKLLTEQIKEAKAFAKGANVIVYLDPADEKNARSLEIITGVSVKIDEKSFGGGTKIYIPSRNILIDNSFDTKLSRIRAGFSFNAKGLGK